MASTSKIVGGFTAVGFLLPSSLLACYSVANLSGKHPNTNLLFYLCPSSIMCIGLDHASVSTAIVVWLFIGFSNAALYSVPGFVIALLLRFRESR